MMSCEFYKDGVTWAARAIARGLRQWRAQLAQRQRKLHQPHKKEQLEGAARRSSLPRRMPIDSDGKGRRALRGIAGRIDASLLLAALSQERIVAAAGPFLAPFILNKQTLSDSSPPRWPGIKALAPSPRSVGMC